MFSTHTVALGFLDYDCNISEKNKKSLFCGGSQIFLSLSPPPTHVKPRQASRAEQHFLVSPSSFPFASHLFLIFFFNQKNKKILYFLCKEIRNLARKHSLNSTREKASASLSKQRGTSFLPSWALCFLFFSKKYILKVEKVSKTP